MSAVITDIEAALAQVLLDPQVRQTVKSSIQEWMFQRDSLRAMVMASLSDEFDNKPINPQILILKIQATFPKLTAEDKSIIQRLIDSYSPVSADDFEGVIVIASAFIKDRLTVKGFDLYQRGKRKEAQGLLGLASNFRLTEEQFIDASDPEKLAFLKRKDMPRDGMVMKSSFSVVNRTLLYKGYKNQDLILVVAPPKTAKTTFMCQEGAAIADQGFKVCHMFLGDMSEYDGVCKYLSCYLSELIDNVVVDPFKYQQQAQDMLSRVRIRAYPANTKTVEDLVADARQLKKKFDFNLLIVDYDANIAAADENMYISGGHIYSCLKGFAGSEGCAVMVASQPKQEFWDLEILEEKAAAESSRKQAAIDAMITFGRCKKYSKVGTCFLPLVRRGESRTMMKVFYDYKYCKIKEITLSEYHKIIQQHEKDADDEEDLLIGPVFQ